jgi:hypothetical protein
MMDYNFAEMALGDDTGLLGMSSVMQSPRGPRKRHKRKATWSRFFHFPIMTPPIIEKIQSAKTAIIKMGI